MASEVMSKSVLALATIAAGGGVLFFIYWYRRRRFNYVSEFIEIGTLSELHLYPVKSMKGIKVSEMECLPIGGKSGDIKDRHFMVMDADTGKFLTGRQFPKLVTIDVDVKDNVLTLRSDDRTVSVNINDVLNQNMLRRAELFQGLKQDGLDCGDEVSSFLKAVLGSDSNLRLIHHVDGLYSERDVISKDEWLLGNVPKRHDRIAYPDDAPYMVLCDNSLVELNSHFSNRTFEMRRFRPVLQIGGAPAFDEDLWAELKIGDVIFSCYRPCTRCVMTTIDPDTGIRGEDVEPLKMLRKYRLAPGRLRTLYGESPIFGVFMGVVQSGVVHEGDKVFARYKTHRC
uniref:MOSC domain-containing protein n=2 Tax=Parascaris univalens TaxID=6257 RepID=A0A915C124_PARUN